MTNEKWIDQNLRWAKILIAAGVIVFTAGVLFPWPAGSQPFNPRLIPALGILLAGLGVGKLVRFGPASRDPQGAGRQLRAENDERNQLLRHRAGNRAYFTSAGLTYALLMWLSLASNGSLPALSDDALWFALAAAVVIPLVVYILSVVIDEQRM